MNIGGLGGGPVAGGVPMAAAAAAGFAGKAAGQPSGISVALDSSAVIRELAADSLTEVLLNMDRKISGSSAHAPELLRAVLNAAATGNVAQAVRLAQNLVVAHPAAAQTLASESGLGHARGEILNMLGHMTNAARAASAHTLEAAAVAVNSGDYPRAMVNGLDPQLVLAVANQYLAAGEYVNYVRAGALGQMLLERRRVPVSPAPVKRTGGGLARLWKRAPLLILLGGWLAAGIVFGLGRLLLGATGGEDVFDIWALGFLVMVGVQFVVTLRNSRY